MKRPDGFAGDRPTGVGGSPARPRRSRERPAVPATGRRADAGTEPIPVVSAPAVAQTGPIRSMRAQLREARRERKRYERGEVRRFTRRARHRRIAWLSAAGILVALVIGVASVAFSPLMALRTIEVTGAHTVDVAAVKKAISPQLGRPMPFIDDKAITAELSAFPLIRSYTIEVHPPSTLVVRIVERTPLGLEKAGSSYRLVDAAGVTVGTYPDRPGGYPLIRPAVDSAGFAAVAAVLRVLPAGVLSAVDTATATTRDDVTFTLRKNGASVVWGSADDSALKAAILTDLLAKAPGAHSYDLSSPHNVVTR